MFGWIKKAKAKREIIVNAENLETRVAVLENGRLEEFQVEHPTEERMVGSIYKGRIQNLEHDLQAAFVDIGMKKNAFLHYWDVLPDDEARLEAEEGGGGRHRAGRRKRLTNEEIEKRFPPGSEIVLQVTKGPIGTKGPRVTANLSIPGRYLVMMPGSQLKGVSRKIADGKERQRLKKILAGMEVPPDVGLIVRTAGSGARKGSFLKDMNGLCETWAELQRAIQEQPAPSCLYQEPDLVERVVRDWLEEDLDRIVVDSKPKYERIRDVAGRISRRTKSRIHLYQGDLPIFDYYEVERQLEEAFRRKVIMESGAYIVFDETEALIAVDVNTGRHKGSGSQEDAILKVNLEAVEEVSRQLRLRNIGGLVVIDLIDMKSKKHQQAVYRAMQTALKRDRAKTNVLPISDLGIMEMTRQRVAESVHSAIFMDCPYCRGRGDVKSPLGVSVQIQRQVAAILRKSRSADQPRNLQVIIHPMVLERLRSEDEGFLMDIETRFNTHLTFKSDPSKHVEYFAISDAVTNDIIYCSAEGAA